VETLLGPDIWEAIRGKVVIDFGCGIGAEAIEMARGGADRVIGMDIRPSVLERAREAAEDADMATRCSFCARTDIVADMVVSLDAFEHFDDPAEIFRVMRRLIKPDGCVRIAFGPTWFHPYGGHLFSVFPWAHLVFTETALIRWRSQFKSDGATRFCEVEGGLNQMTLGRFRRLLRQSDFAIDRFEAVPIRRLRALHTSVTAEFLTAIVRCSLRPRGAGERATLGDE
jgi:SAM-dependent methyltransferase